MRRPSFARRTVDATEVAITYLRGHVAAGDTPTADRVHLHRAIRFFEDLIAYRRSTPPKGKRKDDHD